MIYIGVFLLISMVWYIFRKNRKRNSQSKPPLIQEEEGNTKQENNLSFEPTIAEPPVLRDGEKVIFVKDGEKEQGTVRIMGAGLQIFDGNGNVAVDITDRVCRYLGEGSTGFTDGFVTNDVFLENVNAWVLPKRISLKRYENAGNFQTTPHFHVSGNKLMWEYDSSTGALRQSLDFYYGVF